MNRPTGMQTDQPQLTHSWTDRNACQKKLTDRLVLVEVSLLEVAELGLQVLEVLRDALVLLCQSHVGLSKFLLMLRVALLQAGTQSVACSDTGALLRCIYDCQGMKTDRDTCHLVM
jgi:hypothetical protein